MANAVFTAKLESTYDDVVEERYHFPKTYLKRVTETIGDWVIYYESRRDGGRQVYFGIAQVVGIYPDTEHPDHFYAQMRAFVAFGDVVPFRTGGMLLESALRNPDGSVNPGAFINAVRLVPRDEFLTICRLGMSTAVIEADLAEPAVSHEMMVAETQAEYGGPRNTATYSRPVRDAAFSRLVKTAYDRTCAMTGLQLINGGGRCEIEAAHIKPVEDDGPDSPRNGIALSRTVHWLFDRGFLSLADDGQILQAPKLVPEPVKRLLRPDGRVIFPSDPTLTPHRVFLRYHRENKFKG